MRSILLVVAFALGAGGCGETGGPASGGASVDVVHGGEARAVELAALATAALGVPLSDVIEESWPELDPAALEVDFIARDGFRPSARSTCQGLVPVPGELLDQGYLEPETANLLWDEALDFPGCLHPDGVATVLLPDRETHGAIVTLVAGESSVEVDLSLLPTVETSSGPRVALDLVVSSSGVVEAPNLHDYDFEASDGSRPAAEAGLDPLPWGFLSSGTIDPVTRDLDWGPDLGLEAAWLVRDVAVIHLSEREVDPGTVEVVHGEDRREVDLGDLPLTRVGSESLVVLTEVVLAAALVDDPSTFGYDFEASDGYRVVEGHDDRVLAPWEALGQGWIDPFSRNVTWAESLDLGSPWRVRDTAIIHVLDP